MVIQRPIKLLEIIKFIRLPLAFISYGYGQASTVFSISTSLIVPHFKRNTRYLYLLDIRSDCEKEVRTNFQLLFNI